MGVLVRDVHFLLGLALAWPPAANGHTKARPYDRSHMTQLLLYKSGGPSGVA